MNSVMNIIPTIFNEREIPYTVLGKTEFNSSDDFSVIVLNRGARYYLPSLFENLISMELNSITYVDSNRHSFEFESLANEFPEVKFIFPYEEVSTGEMINLGMRETISKFVLVIWNDMSLTDNFLNTDLIKKMQNEKTMCITPILIDSKNNRLRVQIVPLLTNMDFSTEQFLCIKDFTKTIYPLDFVGIYSRDKFINIGGFDYNIKNPYWQNFDFSFRANLWSYNFLISNSLKIKYLGNSSIEHISADISYIQFYLKNLALLVNNRGAYLPKRIFFSYLKKSGLNPLKAYRYFNMVKDWVNVNKYKFLKSPQKLISEWEPII